MIIYLCTKFQSNPPILSKDIARKPKMLRMGRKDVCTDSRDTYSITAVRTYIPIENGGGIKKYTIISCLKVLKTFISCLKVLKTSLKFYYDTNKLLTLQMGHKENPKVILGPTHFFLSICLAQWRWNTCPHFSCKINKIYIELFVQNSSLFL